MLSKNEIFIKSNLRKSKRQIVSICLLSVLAAILLNVILILFGDFKDNFYRRQKEQNCASADLLYVDPLGAVTSDGIRGVLDEIPGITGYEVDKTVSGFGTVDFSDGLLSNIVTVMPIGYAKNKTIDRFKIVSDSGDAGVYLGYLFESGGGFAIGDTVTVNFNGQAYEYPVVGFYDALGTGSVNCLDITLLLTDDLYDSFAAENADAYRVAVMTEDGDPDTLNNEVNARIQSAFPTLLLLDSQICDDLYAQRYTNASVFEAILIASTCIMIVVTVFVIAVSLRNYVGNNITAYGTFKAIGYRSRELILPLLLEFAVLELLAVAVGVGLSYLVFIPINAMLESQIGIPYEIRFLPLPAIVTLLFSVITVVLTTYFSVRKIRVIPAIASIRQDGAQKQSGVGAVNLATAKLGVNTALGLKKCLGGLSRSLIIFFVLVGVGFLGGFSVYLSDNILGDVDGVLSLICGQTPDSIVRIDPAKEEKLLGTLSTDEDVLDFYLFTMQTLTPEGRPPINAYVIENTEYINADVLISGELPKAEDEVALNKAYADKNGLSEGDTLKIDGFTYRVCGLVQGAYYSGNDCFILRSGYDKIGELKALNYYVDLSDGVGIDAFNGKVTAALHPTLVVNQRSYLLSLSDMYANILRVLGVILVVLSVLIIAFVLYVILSILLENEKKDHGILKSIGFVSRQIVYQTLVSIFPSCLLGTALGLFLAGRFSDDLIVVNLRSMGIFRFGSAVRVSYLFLCGAGLLAFVILYTCLLSRSVKKITPHDLFNRE